MGIKNLYINKILNIKQLQQIILYLKIFKQK